jgi:predicted O-methyltransferase YrrM
MFHNLPQPLKDRMAQLETMDAFDRQNDTPVMERLRQVPPQTGKLLALLAACAPDGQFLEIGTSAGYSGLWISLACRQRGSSLVTFELLPEKVKLARETFQIAGVDSLVKIVPGNVLDHLGAYQEVAFCFLDTEKELYQACYDLVLPNLVPGGLLVADNVISHAEVLGPFVSNTLADQRLDALVVPIGQGVLVGRKA